MEGVAEVVVNLRGLVRRGLVSGLLGKTGTRFFGLDLREPAAEDPEPECSGCKDIWECPRSRKGDGGFVDSFEANLNRCL